MFNKLGLMLGGGGAKGIYQVGVLKALEEEGIINDIEITSGTSIGAINTILLMSNQNINWIYNMWIKLNTKNIFDLKKIRRDKLGFYSLEDIFNELILDIPLNSIRNSRIKGYATCSRLIESPNLLNQINKNKLVMDYFLLNNYKYPYHAVLASASIPVIFGSIYLDGYHYVDGGLTEQYPFIPLLNNDCNIILSIPLDNKYDYYKYQNEDILIIDFYTKMYFNKQNILDNLNTIKFTNNFKIQKANEGYIAGKILINILKKNNILINHNNKIIWNKPKGFKIISMDKEE